MTRDSTRVQRKTSLKDYDTRDPDRTGKLTLRTTSTMWSNWQAAGCALRARTSRALLLIFQAMDAAGKDSVIKHVMSGVNPQGCQVFSFKTPSSEELDHDYLWRCLKALPERGRIGIFNRSYYEEVLVVRVHPEYLKNQNLPSDTLGKPLEEAL